MTEIKLTKAQVKALEPVLRAARVASERGVCIIMQPWEEWAGGECTLRCSFIESPWADRIAAEVSAFAAAKRARAKEDAC